MNNTQLIEITKELLSTFSKELGKCDKYTNDTRVEYYYLLEWVNNLYKKDKNIQKNVILNLFNENIKKLVNEYILKKNDYSTMNSAVGSAVFYKFFNSSFSHISYI